MGRSIYDDYTTILTKPFNRPKLDNNLKQRENFKAAFDHFDYKKIAQYSDDKILDLLQDAGIILKVYSAVTNAKLSKIKEEFGSFSQYIWAFVNHTTVKTSQET
jgi:DNA-3-methyladenine glycosylase I